MPPGARNRPGDAGPVLGYRSWLARRARRAQRRRRLATRASPPGPLTRHVPSRNAFPIATTAGRADADYGRDIMRHRRQDGVMTRSRLTLLGAFMLFVVALASVADAQVPKR